MSERAADVERKREARASAKDLVIDFRSVDWSRRERVAIDPLWALRHYFPLKFVEDWTPSREAMVEAIWHAITKGGDQAVAAERGGGKTSIVEGEIVLALLVGLLRFPVIVAATHRDSEQILDNIKAEFDANDELLADFPEVCECIRALEGANQLAGSQTVLGRRTKMKWAGDKIVLPEVVLPSGELSPASGAVLATRAIDGHIRGMRHGNQRPDFVLLDDPDSEDSAASDVITAKREKVIEQTIGGLGGTTKPISRIMLCTLLNRRCLAAKYTDPSVKASWKGRRFRLLEELPEDADSWNEYIRLRKDGFDPDSETDIEDALRYYVDNREAMDAGAVVGNPGRYARESYPRQVSAVQAFYDDVADKGWPYALTELQNDPPPDDPNEERSGITEAIVRGSHKEYAGRCRGVQAGVALDGTNSVTAFIDVGKRRLHWLVMGWRSGGRAHVVDYGVHRTDRPDVVGEEAAISTALDELADAFSLAAYASLIRFVGVDAGHWNRTIYDFVGRHGEPYRATMGDSKYRHPKPGREKRPGPDVARWYHSRQPSGTWVVNFDPDHWKHDLHSRLMTQPGVEEPPAEKSVTLFGSEPREHVELSEHLTAEEYVRRFVDGKGWKESWNTRHKQNHWFDCAVGCLVGHSVTANRNARPSVRVSELSR